MKMDVTFAKALLERSYGHEGIGSSTSSAGGGDGGVAAVGVIVTTLSVMVPISAVGEYEVVGEGPIIVVGHGEGASVALVTARTVLVIIDGH